MISNRCWIGEVYKYSAELIYIFCLYKTGDRTKFTAYVNSVRICKTNFFLGVYRAKMARTTKGKTKTTSLSYAKAKKNQKESVEEEKEKEEKKIYAIAFYKTGEVNVHDTEEERDQNFDLFPEKVKEAMGVKRQNFSNEDEVEEWKQHWFGEEKGETIKGFNSVLKHYGQKRRKESNLEDDVPDLKVARKQKSAESDNEGEDDDEDEQANKNKNKYKDNLKKMVQNEEPKSPLLKKLEEHNLRKGMTMVVHCFKNMPTPDINAQVLLIEFLGKAKFTHWIHRSEPWVEVIQFMNDEEPESIPSNFLRNLEHVFVTDKKVDEAETRPLSGGKKLYRCGFKAYIKANVKKEDILDHLENYLAPLYTNETLMRSYAMQRVAEINTPNEGMTTCLQRRDPTKKQCYWAELEGAVTRNRRLEEHENLREVFLSKDVSDILMTLYCDHDFTTSKIRNKSLPEDVLSFAYGYL